MIKAAIFLVETSHMKAPPASAYGDDRDPFTPKRNDGYIPRHMRLAFTYCEMVHPYVVFEPPRISVHKATVSWVLNGCVSIDEMTIEVKVNGTYQEFNKTTTKGECNYASRQTVYSHEFDARQPQTQFRIRFKADSQWGEQNHPVPNVPPQTYLARLRLDPSLEVTNAN